MNTYTKNLIRTLVILTVFFVSVYVSSFNDGIGNNVNWFVTMTILTSLLCGGCWYIFKDMSQEDLYEILFVNKLKKIGFDIDEF